MKVTKNWKKMGEIYKYFADDDSTLDFSDEAALACFEFETYGKGDFKQSIFSTAKLNGFVVGKHWMDATIKMWIEDIRSGLLRPEELYQEYPQWHWWLDRVIKKPLGI